MIVDQDVASTCPTSAAAGGGTYGDLLPHTIEIDAFGVRCRYLDLETLVKLKRAAGRPKDLEAIAELELLRARS